MDPPSAISSSINRLVLAPVPLFPPGTTVVISASVSYFSFARHDQPGTHAYVEWPTHLQLPASSTSDDRAEDMLSRVGQRKCLYMLVHTDLFDHVNSHLSRGELAGVKRVPSIWPGHKPVFSAYVPPKQAGYYTQVKPTADMFTDGKRHSTYAHRVSCMIAHGSDPAPSGKVTHCSHRLGTGIIQGIERDFNPNNLCWENERLNKSRGFCQLYFIRRYNELSVANPEAAQDMIFKQAEEDTWEICRYVHVPYTESTQMPTPSPNDYLCHFWNPAWGVTADTFLPKVSELVKYRNPTTRDLVLPRPQRGQTM